MKRDAWKNPIRVDLNKADLGDETCHSVIAELIWKKLVELYSRVRKVDIWEFLKFDLIKE